MRHVRLSAVIAIAGACKAPLGTDRPFAANGSPCDGGPCLHDCFDRVDKCTDQLAAAHAQPVMDGYSTTELCNAPVGAVAVDENRNHLVDEGCPCMPGATQQCFSGPPGRLGHGICTHGTQTCQMSTAPVPDGGTAPDGGAMMSMMGTWGLCVGDIPPAAGEVCNHADDDCNGCVDEDLCCSAVVSCPEANDPRISAPIRPFQTLTLDGSPFFGGDGAFQWSVKGGPCEAPQYGITTFALANPESRQAQFTPTLSGDYNVTMQVTPTGSTAPVTCPWQVHVQGAGLRVELCWDTQQNTDIDLWLHNSTNTSDWFPDPGAMNMNPYPDTCGYANCKSSPYTIDWMYPDTPGVSECNLTDVSDWTERGNCPNPRLDLDNTGGAGRPENISLDAPNPGAYRILVNFFGHSTPTHPLVNIYCGGTLKSTFGALGAGDANAVHGFDTAGANGANGSGSMWKVADVQMLDASNCAVLPLRNMDGTYVVVNGDKSYGPPTQ